MRLGESSFDPDVIAIADSDPAAVADEMRGFAERNHPNAKLVTIGDALLPPDGIAHWLSSADPASDLPDRIREILGWAADSKTGCCHRLARRRCALGP